MDVDFSDDGSQVFTVNSFQYDSLNLNMNTLSIGFELNAVDTQDEFGSNNNGKGLFHYYLTQIHLEYLLHLIQIQLIKYSCLSLMSHTENC